MKTYTTLYNHTSLYCLFIILITTVGCSNLEDKNLSAQNNSVEDIKIIDGTLQINTKSSLKELVSLYNDTTTQNKFNDGIKTLQDKGFKSLHPVLDVTNISEVKAFSVAKQKRIASLNKSFGITSKTVTTDEVELTDEIVTDPALASLLNEDREIVVGDSLYKYTETGLYFCLKKDKEKLYNYLNKLSSTQKKNIIVQKQISPNKSLTAKVIPIDEGIDWFLPPSPKVIIDPAPLTTVILPDPTVILNNRINDLPVCEGSGGGLLSDIFGTNLSCIDYFDGRHRIKTEYWDQNYFFYKSTGVEVRTQVKTLWIWWASDSDEIHLGINRIYLKYDNPIPQINSIPYLNTSPYLSEVPVYMYKGEFKIQQNNLGNFIAPTFIKANSNLPFFEFGQGINMLNIYIRKLPFVDQNYTVRNESNIKALYQLGIDFLKKNFNSGAKINDPFVVSYQANPQAEVEVLYFGERLSATNTNIIKRTFYSDRQWQVGIAVSNGSVKPTFGVPSYNYFRNYTKYELDFYGLARQGDTWKGNRMKR